MTEAAITAPKQPSPWLAFSRHVVAALIVASIQPVSGRGLELLGSFIGGLLVIFGFGLFLAALITGGASLFFTEATRRVRSALFLWCLWVGILAGLLMAWLEHYHLGEFTRPLLLSFLALSINALLLAFLAQFITLKAAGFKPPFMSAFKALFFGGLAGNAILGVPALIVAIKGQQLLPVGYAALTVAYVAAVTYSFHHFVRSPDGLPISLKLAALITGLLLLSMLLVLVIAGGAGLLIYKLGVGGAPS